MCALTARVRPPGSIHNDRRLLCQPVCQHRIPGQQLSEHPTAVSVLVPLIKINKETTKFKKKKKRFLKKGGEENLRHGNIPQPSPTEMQNLDVVSHSALPSSSPGTPAFQSRPVLGALGRGLSGAVHQQPSRKKHAMRTLLSRGQTERMQQDCLPPTQSGLPRKKQPARWPATPAVPGDPTLRWT